MSCDTLNQQSIGLNVAVGNLPEGFCPASMQELLQAFAARLIVTPNQGFFGFAIGSTAPTSNVGPWLRDCLEIFVFDDATASYVPLQVRNTFSNQQYYTSSDTFTVPEFVTKLRVQAWGGGGGGGRDTGNVGAAGGGGGAYCQGIFTVVPGSMIAVTIGAGGTQGTPGSAGGATTCNGMSAGGGLGAPGGSNNMPVAGGTATGGTININGQSSFNGVSGFGGAGGDSPNGGGGGTFINPPSATLENGKVPGGGGSGDYANTGAGNGAGGAVLIEW